MTDTDQESEDEVLRRILKTPPKPHKPLAKEGRDDGNGNRDSRPRKR